MKATVGWIPDVIRVALGVLGFALGYYFYYRVPSERGRVQSAALVTIPSLLLTALTTWLGANAMISYGWGLFVLLPVGAGFLATILRAAEREVTATDASLTGLAVAVLSGMTLAGLAIEGFVCLAMAFPLAGLLTIAGAMLAWALLRGTNALRGRGARSMCIAGVIFVVPGGVEVEARLPRQTPVFEVVTSAEIDAPPEAVWRAAIAPSKLPRPAHPIFRAGIAYPMAAHIEGSGAGATRYCNFSTGNLVEPVLVWDEPRVLRFSVVSNPQPMQEWTLYGDIHPPHLDGFLVSKQGEFRLEPLAGGRTRLHATTWYEHNLYPAAYWRWWSDYILHRVHDVVLENIKRKAESL